MPMFSDDPVVIVLTIIVAWSFYATCKLRDRLSGRRAGKRGESSDSSGRTVVRAAVRPSPPLFDQDAR